MKFSVGTTNPKQNTDATDRRLRKPKIVFLKARSTLSMPDVAIAKTGELETGFFLFIILVWEIFVGENLKMNFQFKVPTTHSVYLFCGRNCSTNMTARQCNDAKEMLTLGSR